MKTISIIIPVYNEQSAVKQTIEGIKSVTKGVNHKIEIIAVNDCSKDRSLEILESIKGIRVISHKINRGYGASIKTGIKNSKSDFILLCDADGTYPIQEIPNLIHFIDKYDMVIGSRSKSSVKIPFLRRPAKWFLNRFASFLAGRRIPDLNSGLRIFNKEKCIEFWDLYPNRFSFTSTITMSFISKEYVVKFIPIDYFKRKGKSSISPFDFYNFTKLLLKLTLFFNPIKIFSAASLSLIIVAVAVAFYSIYYAERLMDTTVILLMLSALQIFLSGLIAHIIVRVKK